MTPKQQSNFRVARAVFFGKSRDERGLIKAILRHNKHGPKRGIFMQVGSLLVNFSDGKLSLEAMINHVPGQLPPAFSDGHEH
jgi:hypothetical protein